MADGMLDASNITPDSDQEVNPALESLQSHKKVLNLIEGLAEKHPELAPHLNQHISIAAGNVIDAMSRVPMDALQESERREEIERQVWKITRMELNIENAEESLKGKLDEGDKIIFTNNQEVHTRHLFMLIDRVGLDALREYLQEMMQRELKGEETLTARYLGNAIERAEKREVEN